MQTKVQAYVQLADETALKITGNYLDWLSFLTTASRLYKYPYHDQLMIYAQRPDASACAAYELWNGTMHRYIRRGAKGIALLNPTANGMRIRYVFDVSDTGTRADSRNVDVWQLTEAAEAAVRKMLAEEFSADASMRLASQSLHQMESTTTVEKKETVWYTKNAIPSNRCLSGLTFMRMAISELTICSQRRTLWIKQFVSCLQELAAFVWDLNAYKQRGRRCGFLNGNREQKSSGHMIAMFNTLEIAKT